MNPQLAPASNPSTNAAVLSSCNDMSSPGCLRIGNRDDCIALSLRMHINAASIPLARRGSAARRRNELKKNVTAVVRGFGETLRHISDLTDRETIEDKELAREPAGFREVVRERLRHIDDDLGMMLERAEWDRMNVGFFGETQHGKSTLIECLTRGNGSSIGTGRKDHTREVTAASIRGMRLLDMPGIEGNEQTVLDQIKAGLHRSHVILHVLPCDKAPERLTLEKVRAHLRNEVMVFALINVFGSARDFAGAPALREHKRATITEIEKGFREGLGVAYRGSFVVAGRIAHATVAWGRFRRTCRKIAPRRRTPLALAPQRVVTAVCLNLSAVSAICRISVYPIYQC